MVAYRRVESMMSQREWIAQSPYAAMHECWEAALDEI